jgi:hypothetical protein
MHLLEAIDLYQEWKRYYLQRPIRPALPTFPRYMRSTQQQHMENARADYEQKITAWEELVTELAHKAEVSLRQVLAPHDDDRPIGVWLVDTADEMPMIDDGENAGMHPCMHVCVCVCVCVCIGC